LPPHAPPARPRRPAPLPDASIDINSPAPSRAAPALTPIPDRRTPPAPQPAAEAAADAAAPLLTARRLGGAAAGAAAALAAAASVAAADEAEHGLAPAAYPWPHDGHFSAYDHRAIRRGFQVYQQVG
jgi:hypothetical protein